MAWASFSENIKVAFRAIRGQLLRTLLAAAIITIGITALVGILTSIDAIEDTLSGNFALLGANTFTIQNRGPNIRIGRNGERPKTYSAISFYEAQRFKERMNSSTVPVSVSYTATGIAEAKYKERSSDPNVRVMAVDENYLITAGYQLASGRNFTPYEVDQAAPVTLIGGDLKEDLFPNSDPLGAYISVRGRRFRVVGLLASKGNSFGFSGDNQMMIPITKARSIYGRSDQSYAVNVMAPGEGQLEGSISEATAIMRAVRKLKPKEESDFHITKSDSLSAALIDNLSKVSAAAVIIAFVTLLGAAIALMNIMLVSVTERTREIGIRKAMGARNPVIRTQFLTEAVVICLMGGLGGILIGILIGNGVARLVGGNFIVPWNWMMVSVLVCLGVGLISGLYPAVKASKLDPIDALRYE